MQYLMMSMLYELIFFIRLDESHQTLEYGHVTSFYPSFRYLTFIACGVI